MGERGISIVEKSKSVEDLKKVKSMGLSEQDLEQINEHGVSIEAIKKTACYF